MAYKMGYLEAAKLAGDKQRETGCICHVRFNKDERCWEVLVTQTKAPQ